MVFRWIAAVSAAVVCLYTLYLFRSLLPGPLVSAILFILGFVTVWFSLSKE